MYTSQCLHSSFSRLPAWLYSLRGMQQLSQLVWVMWASLMDMCQTLIFMASKLSFHLFSFTLGFLFHTLLPGSLENLLNSGVKRKSGNWFPGLPQHQSWCHFVACPCRKWSPAEAHVHQTARQCGVPTSSWRESKRGGVQLRGPRTPDALLQVTPADMTSHGFCHLMWLILHSLGVQPEP